MFHLLTSPPSDAEVIVVGAGPAGAATAAWLAGAGVDVLLVDRETFPRDKVCGDFLSAAALAELDVLGVGRGDRPLRTNAVTRAAVFLDGELLVEDAPANVGVSAPVGRVVPRLVLDASIVDVARRRGARVLQGHSVVWFRREAGRALLDVVPRDGARRTLRTRLVVGADGSNSLLARVVRRGSHPRSDRIIAVRAYYRGVAGPSDRAGLHFAAASFPGYAWLFPTGEGTANVGVGSLLETRPPRKHHLIRLLDRIVVEDRQLHAQLGPARRSGKPLGWPLSTYNGTLPMVADNVLLVGDAAGLINPLNGEGIQYALASARWAAELVIDNRAAHTRGDLQPYADRLLRELDADLTLARLIVELISNRALNPFWLLCLRAIAQQARADAGYASTAGGILSGVVPARNAAGLEFFAATAEPVIALMARAAFGPSGLERGSRLALDTGATVLGNPRAMAEWAETCSRRAIAFARASARAGA